MRKHNTCNYSTEWQPYIGDYDKFEYDVKLKDGTVIENCYPNGGNFTNWFTGGKCNESQVAEIRFSINPKHDINPPMEKVIDHHEMLEDIFLPKNIVEDTYLPKNIVEIPIYNTIIDDTIHPNPNYHPKRTRKNSPLRIGSYKQKRK